MAKRKATSYSVAKSKGKTQQKARPAANRTVPIVVIAVALISLIVYAGARSGNSTSTAGTATTAAPQQSQQASMTTGVEALAVGTVEAGKAKVATFKLQELSNSGCAQSIVAELKKQGAVGKVRADYTNKLFEVEYDSSNVTEAKIIEALSKANHPGKATTEKIR